MKTELKAIEILEEIRKNDELYIVNANKRLTEKIQESIQGEDWDLIKEKNNQQESISFNNKTEIDYQEDLMWYKVYEHQLNEYMNITQKIPENTRFKFIKKAINKTMKVSTRYQELFNQSVVGMFSGVVRKIVDIERNIHSICHNIDQINEVLKFTEHTDKIKRLEEQIIQIQQTYQNTINCQRENSLKEFEIMKQEVEQYKQILQDIEHKIELQGSYIQRNEKWIDVESKRIQGNEKWIESTNKRIDGQDKWLNEIVKRVEQQEQQLPKVRSELMGEIRREIAVGGNRSNNISVEEIKAEILPSYYDYIERHPNEKKVNVGCGLLTKEDYINVDGRALEGVDVVADVRNMPFSVNELDEIYAAHLIEHFELRVLKEELLPYWYKLLKKGGKLTIVVPNIESMIKQAYDKEIPFTQFREVVFGGQDYSDNYHYTMFNEEELRNLLLQVGFENIDTIVLARQNGMCLEMEMTAQK